MYTQCPDCDIAFKVTAEDLKQAGGQVVCAECGNAFNALSYLSENKPEKPAANGASTALPELTPEIVESESGPTEGTPPDQSAALLKTLGDLDGSNVRILDTGTEWQVLDEVTNAADELRFDDNTPLPDDFDATDESTDSAKSEPSDKPFDEDDNSQLPDEEPQPGIALGELDEWKDILGEFLDLAKEVAADDPISDDISDAEPEVEPKEELPDELDITDSVDDWVFDGEIKQLDLIDEQTNHEDERIVKSHAIEGELDDEPSSEFYVPPMTEEEHTVNMLIDQDLMALAVEDQDGFISTMVIAEENSKKKANEKNGLDEDDEFGEEPETASSLESIIMEGETIRTAIESGELAESLAAALEPINLPREDEFEGVEESGGPRYGLIAAAVLLTLSLAAQAVHQFRGSLATIPAFSNTIGQIYRAIGQPIQPAWDITGWRFEATKGSAEGEDGNLTVYSRLGNSSAGPLPYPIIGISLTDRFEESIGSRVLDPAEYLPSDLDPRKLVARGDTFNAVITIKSASEDATGFKLNVCYRSNDDRLRCAIDDFK
jgi:predicted Zn finger-like uncharacterized protein